MGPARLCSIYCRSVCSNHVRPMHAWNVDRYCWQTVLCPHTDIRPRVTRDSAAHSVGSAVGHSTPLTGMFVCQAPCP